MMSKKGFEIQFNWLFVLVAGAAILLFFTVLVVRHRDISQTSTKATVLKNVEAVIAGASVSTDTISVLDIPNSNIEISCNRVSVDGVSRQYQNLILFAPNLIKGDKLVTQTMGFSIPYKITNLLYMTSPQIRYRIIGNNDFAKESNKSLPIELKKEFYKPISIPTIRNLNNYKVRFIVFEDFDVYGIDLTNLEKMQDSDVTAIKVVGDINQGEIQFYVKDGDSWSQQESSFYIGKPYLIGAIYSDALEDYECNMENVFSRLNLVTQVYVKRTEELKKPEELSSIPSRQISSRQECTDYYENALIDLKNILTTSSEFNEENVNALANAADSLLNQNKNAQENSCILIY